MRALGAAVVRTPDADGMQGAIDRAKQLVARDPNAFMAGQFENQANPDFHYQTTAPEIFAQMEGRVDAVILGCGTCGTFTGVARYLKEKLPQVLAYAVETQGSILGGGPPGPHKEAFGMVKELAAKQGVLAGSSGGAAVFAAVKIATRLGAGRRVVTIVPDSAERYLSKKIFEGGI